MADLTTWLTAKSVLDLNDSQQTDTERLISIASARADNHTSRRLAAQDVTLYLDGRGGMSLDVREHPINSVTSVHMDSGRDFGSDTEVTDYDILSERGQLFRSGGWAKGKQNIKVVCNVGYATVPDDLEESILQLVGYWLQSPNVGWLETGSAEAGGYQTRYVGVLDVPFQIRNVWDAYRRVPV